MSKVSICAIVLNYSSPDKMKECLTSTIKPGLTTVYILDNSASTAAAAHLRNAVEALVTTGLDKKTQILSA